MSHKNKSKKIIVIALIIVIISSAFLGNINSVYGKINGTYSAGDTTGSIDVEQAVSDSDILDSIAHFIYAIACFIEKIIASVIAGFSGNDVFPWADRVIFNTMPFLDVNFLSPASGSMFEDLNGEATIFGVIIRNMYYTIFILSLTFFGVVVGIMAMKLAISSIASEKAKYKQAITNWLFALILIFTAHYLISFIFFVNEKMVEIAGSILKDQVEDVNFEIDISNWSDAECEHMVDLLKENLNALTKVIKSEGTVTSVKGDVTLSYSSSNSDITVKNKSGADGYIVQDIFDRHLVALLTTPDYMEDKGYHDYAASEWYENYAKEFSLNAPLLGFGGPINFLIGRAIDENTNIIEEIVKDATLLTAEDISFRKSKDTYDVEAEDIAEKASTSDVKEALSYVYKVYIRKTEVQKKDIFTNMAAFFKNSVYTFKTDKNGKITSSSASEFSAIPAILYSIFIIQSIMYFIAYLKRFFYIIVLALFAPIVIIYDFLTKTSMT